MDSETKENQKETEKTAATPVAEEKKEDATPSDVAPATPKPKKKIGRPKKEPRPKPEPKRRGRPPKVSVEPLEEPPSPPEDDENDEDQRQPPPATPATPVEPSQPKRRARPRVQRQLTAADHLFDPYTVVMRGLAEKQRVAREAKLALYQSFVARMGG